MSARLIQHHDVAEHPDERQKNYEEDEDGKLVPHRYACTPFNYLAVMTNEAQGWVNHNS